MNRQQTGFYDNKNNWLVFSILLLICVAVAFYCFVFYSEKKAIYQYFHQKNTDKVFQISELVNQLNQSTLNTLKIFTVVNQQLISDLIKQADNEQAQQALQRQLKLFFPDFFAFTLADEQGKVLLTDFDGLVLEKCLQNIRQFAKTRQNRFSFHPNPLANHYDFMVPFQYSGESYIFFVSFYIEKIAYLLAQADPDEFRLFLLNKSNGLIDVDAKSFHNKLRVPVFLSDTQKHNPTLTGRSIKNSEWKLISYTPRAYLNRQIRKVSNTVAVVVVFSAITIIALLLVIARLTRKKREKELRVLNHYHKLFNESNVISFVIRMDNGAILEANKAACRFYGYSVDELTQKLFTDLAGETGNVSTRKFGRLINGVENTFSCVHNLKNGKTVYLEAFFTEFSDQHNEFYLVQLYDVTDKEQLNQLIQQKTELLESVARALPDLIFILDQHGNYIDVFDEAMPHGETLKTIKGKNIADLFPQDQVKQALDMIRLSLQQKQLQTFEYQTDIFGKKLWFEGRIVPMQEKEEQTPKVLWLARNIDQRKKMEMDLSIAATVMHTMDPVIVADHKGIIVKVNDAFVETFGFKPAELYGNNLSLIRSKKEQQNEQFKKIDQALQEKGYWRGVTYNKNKQGQEFSMLEQVHTVRDDWGKIVNIVGIFKDLSEIDALHESLTQIEARFKAIIEQGNDFVMVTTGEGIAYASPSIARASGYTLEEFKKMQPQDNIDPEYLDTYINAFRQCLKKFNRVVSIKPYRARKKDGSWMWIEGTLTNMRHIKGVNGLVFVGQDVTKRVMAENSLKQEAVKFRALIEKGSDFICIFGNDRKITYASPSMSRALGFSEDEIIGQKIIDMVHPDDIPVLIESFSKLMKNPGSSNHLPDIRIRHKDGHYILVEGTSTALFDVEGINGVVFNGHDVTEKRRVEQRLKHQAYHDALTGLPNRQFLMKFLSKILSTTKRHGHYGVIAFIDLDHFKIINDSLGHNIGDLLLQAVSKRIQQNLREEDLLARLGGDEFIIVLPEITDDEQKVINHVERFCNKILESTAKKFVIENHELYISPSIGIKIFSRETSESLDELLQHADGAMYKAKSLGRNRFVFYDDAIQLKANKRIELEKDLRTAIKEKQFTLYYQPQYNTRRQIVGAESLIRWNHPQKGLISPFDFISVAEETGLILELGSWIIQQALSDLQSWLQQGLINRHFSLAINISPRQFSEAGFVDHFIKQMETMPQLKGMVKIEITENLLMDNLALVSKKMHQLKEYGIRFALDDFGTGYSSMEYLTKLPIDQLKIDRSFVKDIEHDPRDAAVVEMILGMALVLDLEIVAEGVETEKQFQFLTSRSDLIIQGYYFSKPLEEILFVEELEKCFYS